MYDQLALCKAANEKLLKDTKYTDVTLICKGETFQCHEIILSQRCEFFQGCFTGNFKESKTRVVELSEDDPRAVKIWIEWLYTYAPPQWADVVAAFDRKLVEILSLLAIADKYGANALKEYVEDHLTTAFSKVFGPLCHYRGFGKDTYDRDGTFEFLEMAAESPDRCFDSIRKKLLQMVCDQWYEKGADTEGIGDALFKIPQVGRALYRHALADRDNLQRSLSSAESEIECKEETIRKLARKIKSGTN